MALKWDNRYLHIVMIIVLTIPFFVTFPLPANVNPWTRGAYTTVEALKPGDVVLVGFDYIAGTRSEIDPCAYAVLSHIFSKPGVKVVIFSLYADGPLLAQAVLSSINPEKTYGKVYGVDYVQYGYFPSDPSTVSSFAADLHTLMVSDTRGTSTANIPMMTNIHSYTDIDLILDNWSESSEPYFESIYRIKYGVPLITTTQALIGTGQITTWSIGVIKGVLVGLSGGFEYESLTAKAGDATKLMASIDLAHVYIIAAIVLTNIIYFGFEKSKKVKT
jgi:hypothetical protein